jgi:DNA-binding XRE family transcriptional regulator
MDRKTLLKNIGQKLNDIRSSLKLDGFQMADRIGAYRTSYRHYEMGDTAPQLTCLYRLAHTDNISLDWLIVDRGPKFYKEQETPIQPLPVPEPPKETETLPPIAYERDVKELLEYMEQDPLLRHELLLTFYKYKKNQTQIEQ